MAKPKLVLYVDVVSPFAYLAFHLLNVCRFICIRMMTAGFSKSVVPSFIAYLDASYDFTIITVLDCYFSDSDDCLKDEHGKCWFRDGPIDY